MDPYTFIKLSLATHCPLWGHTDEWDMPHLPGAHNLVGIMGWDKHKDTIEDLWEFRGGRNWFLPGGLMERDRGAGPWQLGWMWMDTQRRGKAGRAVTGLRRHGAWWLTARIGLGKGNGWKVRWVMWVEARLVRTTLNVRPTMSFGLYGEAVLRHSQKIN